MLRYLYRNVTCVEQYAVFFLGSYNIDIGKTMFKWLQELYGCTFIVITGYHFVYFLV